MRKENEDLRKLYKFLKKRNEDQVKNERTEE